MSASRHASLPGSVLLAASLSACGAEHFAARGALVASPVGRSVGSARFESASVPAATGTPDDGRAPPSPTAALREMPSSAAASLAPRTEQRSPPRTGSRERLLDEPTPPRCPPDMALVGDRVCVDRWEASLVAWRQGSQEQAWSPYEAPRMADSRLRAVAIAGVVPQGYVSGKQAAAACIASGKRLCAAGEWELACGGAAGASYPYGETRERGACNDTGRAVHPVVEAARRTGLPPERMWYEGMDSPLINQLPGTVRPTGASRRCVGEYGTYDMVGNLHEWIDDPNGTFRGGFFMDTQINGEGCAYATTAHGFDYHDYSTGFRCCLAPDPVE